MAKFPAGMENDIRDIKRGIPQDLWRRARSAAVLSGVPVKQWMASAIREKLGERQK